MTPTQIRMLTTYDQMLMVRAIVETPTGSAETITFATRKEYDEWKRRNSTTAR